MDTFRSYMVSLQKIWSYILPFRIKKFHSLINGDMQVNFINGRKRLDAKNSNYSFGSITEILQIWLKHIQFDTNTQSVLLLWLGWGSVVQTIRETLKSEAYIEAIDIDPDMIEVAKKEFGLERFNNIKIVEADAIVYIRDTQGAFDLIIIDLFINNVTPEIFTEKTFIVWLTSHLSPSGKIIFNMMRKTMQDVGRDRIKELFLVQGLEVEVLEEVRGTNDLVIARRKGG
jgi:spermidine synthase